MIAGAGGAIPAALGVGPRDVELSLAQPLTSRRAAFFGLVDGGRVHDGAGVHSEDNGVFLCGVRSPDVDPTPVLVLVDGE